MAKSVRQSERKQTMNERIFNVTHILNVNECFSEEGLHEIQQAVEEVNPVVWKIYIGI